MVELRLTRTKSNLFYTVKDNARTFFHGSSGSFSPVKGKRSAPLCGELSALTVCKQLASSQIKSLDIVVVGPVIDRFLKAVFRGLRGRGILFRTVSVVSNVSHNGLRKSKFRRV